MYKKNYIVKVSMSILHLRHRGHQINQFYKVPSSEALMLQTGPGDSGGCREGGREGLPVKVMRQL